jgi:hypothetical protein
MSGYELEAGLVTACAALATRCGLKLERIGQRKAKGSGTDRGAPDAFLYVAGFAHPLEFKRPKSDATRAGRFSHDQIVAADRRRAQGVETYAPRQLQEFANLIGWSKRNAGRYRLTCPACPIVEVERG